MDREKIMKDPDLKNIYMKMLDYLSQRDMSEQRLVDRINRLKVRYPKSERYLRYTKENAWRVIPLLRDDGYLDEDRYARHVFEALKDKRDGLRIIKRKMHVRQIRREVVDDVIREFQERSRQDLSKIIESARKKLERLRHKAGTDPLKKKQVTAKLYGWLSMRGFGTEEIAEISKKIR